MLSIILNRCINKTPSLSSSLSSLSSLASLSLPRSKVLKRTRRPSFVADYRLDLLKNYKRLYGDLFVPKLYHVPYDHHDWNSKYWGFRLGKYVQLMRRSYNKKVIKPKELEDIGFIWNVHYSKYLQIKLGLLTYQSIYGDMLIPADFIVPHDDQWDKEIHGIKLGKKVHHIRFQNQYKTFKEDLKSIGLVWDREVYIYEKTIRALKRYKEIFGDLMVSKTFIVPKDDDSWSDELKGFDLGRIVGHIRYDKKYQEYKDELDKIGFIWRIRNAD